MQIYNYIDKITQAEANFLNEEEEYLYDALNQIEFLYNHRRENKEEQKFWNQFWHSWDFYNLQNAYLQAFSDMFEDSYFSSVKNKAPIRKEYYCNFEKVVSHDQYLYKKYLINILANESVNFSNIIFYDIQASIQNYISCNIKIFHSDEILNKKVNIDFSKNEKIRVWRKFTHFIEQKKFINNIIEKTQSKAKTSNVSYVNLAHNENKSPKERLIINEEQTNKVKKSKYKVNTSVKNTPTKIKSTRNKSKKFISENSSRVQNHYRLKISTPNGNIIDQNNSNNTFLEFLRQVGFFKVESLKITCNGELLIDTYKKNKNYVEIGTNLYLFRGMSTQKKIDIIYKICQLLGLSYFPFIS